ncbi:MAG TPA: hypothetical protein VE987_22585 [Polyangiaceae bacterium]|nr:hypothetical protein [Polyangiaceae bacterium]
MLRVGPSPSPTLAKVVAASAVAVVAGVVGAPAAAQEEGAEGTAAPPAVGAPASSPAAAPPGAEQLPAPAHKVTLREDTTNPLRESVLVFDQSVTTQTAGVGVTPQSYVPLYELWLSFRPRYYFDEHWSVRGRFDYTKELTNSQTTTYRNEDVFGDVWTDLVYEASLDRWWHDTKVDVGPRALWPTSKVSQGNGTYVTLGARAGAQHTFQIHGEAAPWLEFLWVRAGFAYLHPFTSATTPTDYGNFAYARQDVDGRSFISDQIVGQTLVEHELWSALYTRLQITPRLSAQGDLFLIDQWHYAPSGTGPLPLSSTSGPDNQHTANTWFVAEIDFDPVSEVTVSLGYYNLANAVATDGQERSLFGGENIWWSPSARVFVDVTAHLDALFEDATGRKFSAERAQAAHEQRTAAHLR